MSDKVFDPSTLLSKPLTEVKVPPTKPTGGYVMSPKAVEFGKSKQKETPFAKITFNVIEALPDVDAEQLALVVADNPMNTWEVSADYYITPDALYRIKELGEHCGISEEDVANTSELLQEIIGKQCVGILSQSPNAKNPERPYVNLDRTAKMPE